MKADARVLLRHTRNAILAKDELARIVWMDFYLRQMLMSHLSLPICQNQVGCRGKKREGKWQRREFSGVQEGNCNYSSSANVHGPSWF